MINMEEKQESKLLRVVSVLVTILLILAVILCISIVFQLLNHGSVSFFGHMMFRVVTGSMEPTMSVGTLLVTKEVDIASIQIDDIVCFRTYDAMIYGSVVTHRVVDILQDADGILLQTKGDANLIADGYFVSQENLVGKVVWFTGKNSVLSTIFSFLSNKVGFLGCIVFPCLLVSGMVLQNSVKNIRNEIRQVQQEAAMASRAPKESVVDLTGQEYQEMIDRIRTELTQELLRQALKPEGEQDVGIVKQEQPDTTE